MARKTFHVDQLRAAANRMLAASPATDFSANDTASDDQSQRLGVIVLLEHVLHETGNYKGYKHLESEWDPQKWALREGHDDTRRMYL
jgi:hypothetical protein